MNSQNKSGGEVLVVPQVWQCKVALQGSYQMIRGGFPITQNLVANLVNRLGLYQRGNIGGGGVGDLEN